MNTINLLGKISNSVEDGTLYDRKINSLLLGLILISTGFLGLSAISSGNFVEPVEAVNTRVFAGGDGSIGDPYQISDVDQLQDIGSGLTMHYVLINDIDASATVGWNTGDGFAPIGDESSMFMGSLDGQGYNITDLFINRITTDDIGLFGVLDTGANLKKIGLINENVSGDNHVGGLVGFNEGRVTNCHATGHVSGEGRVGELMGSNEGTVSNCYATGNAIGNFFYLGGLVGFNAGGTISYCYTSNIVSGESGVGGLVGSNSGTIEDSYSTGNVDGNEYIGGLAGYVSGPIDKCYATGDVRGTNVVGGLVGENNENLVSNCHASGNVSGTGNAIGGLVGYHDDGTISNCHATGVVTGITEVGGLVGSLKVGTIESCYATGYVSGTDEIGGLVGSAYDSISSCYAAGDISGVSYIGGIVGNNAGGTLSNCYATGDISGEGNEIGGLVGENTGFVSKCYATGRASGEGNEIGGLIGFDIGGTIDDCFWDMETSEMADSDGGTGKTTFEMKRKSTFTSAGWNLDLVWDIIEDHSYPFLNGIPYPLPRITSSDMILATEETQYMATYTAALFLPDSTYVAWSMQTDAGPWLSMTTGGILSGTPSNGDVGEHWVEITANDGREGDDTIRSFTLTVQNTNDAPEINIMYTNATEDVLYSMVLFAIDMDPTEDNLTWVLESGPTWLELNITTNKLEGTPLNSDVGINEFNVSVDDGNGGSDWQNFTIFVENTNDGPIITIYPMNSTLEDEHYSVLLNATDEDPVEINFTWLMDTNAGWLELGGTYLNGTPGNSDVGTFWVNITVIDGYGGSHSLNYTLVVSNVNDAPVWSLTPIDQNITEGEALTLDCLGTDIDGDNITYSIETTPTSGLTIDPSSGVISWASPVVGTYTATITATDGIIQIQHTFSIIVEAIPDDIQTDTDGDGMPDVWEEEHGLDPDDASDAELDADGDGISNLNEYKQGSDPNVDESTDGSTDGEDKGSIATVCLLMALIMFIPLVIIVVIVALVVKSRKGKTAQDEE